MDISRRFNTKPNWPFLDHQMVAHKPVRRVWVKRSRFPFKSHGRDRLHTNQTTWPKEDITRSKETVRHGQATGSKNPQRFLYLFIFFFVMCFVDSFELLVVAMILACMSAFRSSISFHVTSEIHLSLGFFRNPSFSSVIVVIHFFYFLPFLFDAFWVFCLNS